MNPIKQGWRRLKYATRTAVDLYIELGQLLFSPIGVGIAVGVVLQVLLVGRVDPEGQEMAWIFNGILVSTTLLFRFMLGVDTPFEQIRRHKGQKWRNAFGGVPIIMFILVFMGGIALHQGGETTMAIILSWWVGIACLLKWPDRWASGWRARLLWRYGGPQIKQKLVGGLPQTELAQRLEEKLTRPEAGRKRDLWGAEEEIVTTLKQMSGEQARALPARLWQKMLTSASPRIRKAACRQIGKREQHSR